MSAAKPALLRFAFACTLGLGLGTASSAVAAPLVASDLWVDATNATSPSPWEYTVGIGTYSGSLSVAQATANNICEQVAHDYGAHDKAKTVGFKAILNSGNRSCRVWFKTEDDWLRAKTNYRNWSSKTVVLQDTDMDTSTAKKTVNVDWMTCAAWAVDQAAYGSVVFQTSGTPTCWYKKSNNPAKLEYQAYRRTILEVDTKTWVRFRQLTETRIQGQDRYGNDIQKFSGISLDGCTLRCAANVECKAYTWRASDHQCWLKSSGGNPTSAAVNLHSGVIPTSTGGGPG